MKVNMKKCIGAVKSAKDSAGLAGKGTNKGTKVAGDAKVGAVTLGSLRKYVGLRNGLIAVGAMVGAGLVMTGVGIGLVLSYFLCSSIDGDMDDFIDDEDFDFEGLLG